MLSPLKSLSRSTSVHNPPSALSPFPTQLSLQKPDASKPSTVFASSLNCVSRGSVGSVFVVTKDLVGITLSIIPVL